MGTCLLGVELRFLVSRSILGQSPRWDNWGHHIHSCMLELEPQSSLQDHVKNPFVESGWSLHVVSCQGVRVSKSFAHLVSTCGAWDFVPCLMVRPWGVYFLHRVLLLLQALRIGQLLHYVDHILQASQFKFVHLLSAKVAIQKGTHATSQKWSTLVIYNIILLLEICSYIWLLGLVTGVVH